MKTITARLEGLEKISLPGEKSVDMPLPELMSHIEELLGLPVGSLPRDESEAHSAGFQNMAEAMASTLGMSLRELRGLLL